jgi:hypothetical protein
VSEEREKVREEADYVKRQDEGDDVEAHKVREAAEDKFAATEEPPDVEAHRAHPKAKP